MGKQKAGKGVARPPHAKSSSQPTSTALGYGLFIIAVLVAAAAMAMPYLQTPVPPPVVTPPKSRSSRGAQQADAAADCSVHDDEMCVAWHKAGYCHRRSKLVTGMPRRCPRTCGLCPGVDQRNPPVAREDRCSRDNQSAAVPAGALHGLFEHILDSFPEYSPTALSTSPYVIRLDNFISAEEAAAFQRVCRPKFERSLAGDQLNPVPGSDRIHQPWALVLTSPGPSCSPALGPRARQPWALVLTSPGPSCSPALGPRAHQPWALVLTGPGPSCSPALGPRAHQPWGPHALVLASPGPSCSPALGPHALVPSCPRARQPWGLMPSCPRALVLASPGPADVTLAWQVATSLLTYLLTYLLAYLLTLAWQVATSFQYTGATSPSAH